MNSYDTMTDAEVSNFVNKLIWKRALKRTAIITTAIVAANVVVHVIEKKMS